MCIYMCIYVYIYMDVLVFATWTSWLGFPRIVDRPIFELLWVICPVCVRLYKGMLNILCVDVSQAGLDTE